MKKNVIIYSFIHVIASFLLIFDLFSSVSISRVVSYNPYYLINNYESTMMQLELTDNLFSVSSASFSQSLNKYAKKNNLLISRNLYTDSNEGNSLFCLYLSDNDIYINERLFLKNGYARGISKDIVYSTNSNDDSTKILIFDLFTDYGDIEVTSIENYPYKNGAFVITNLKGDLSSNFKNFINDLSNEYGEISYRNDTSLLGKNFYTDLEAAGNLFDDLLIKISICIIITINFIINLLMIRKKITSLKLEGYSIFQIYNDFFLRNFIIYVLLFSLIFSVILFAIYGSNIYSFKIMIVLFYIQLAQMFLIQIFVSLFSCLIINNFEIVKSMKGYKNFNTVFYLIKLCKIVILVLFIPLIKTNILNIANYYKITSRYEQVNKKLENYYYFSFIKNSNYVVGSKQAIAIRDQLVKETNLFEVIHTHYTNYDTFTPYGDFYALDVNFANNCGLKIENEDEVYIFLREGAQYDEEFLKERALEFIDRYTNINIVYYDFNIESYIPNDLLYSDDLSNYPIFYIPEIKGREAQLNSKYFYYEGDLLECQDYIDSVFINNGFSPLFAVAKLSSQYKSEYDYRVEEIRHGWIVFVLLLISYIYLNILLIKIDMTNNKKKYFIKYCEGENPYNIFSFLKIFSITCLISLIISLIIDSLTISDVLYAIIFILLIEVICYLVSYKLGGYSHD